MVSWLSASHDTSRTRWLLRALASLMVFVQLGAAAAAACPDHLGGQPRIPQTCASFGSLHHGAGGQACAEDFSPPGQAPAGERAVQPADLAPPCVVAAAWPDAPRLEQAQPGHEAEPLAPQPRFLTLRRLLR